MYTLLHVLIDVKERERMPRPWRHRIAPKGPGRPVQDEATVGRSPRLTCAGECDEQDGDDEVRRPADQAGSAGDERASARKRGRLADRYPTRGRATVVDAAHAVAQIVISQGASAPAST